MRLLRVWVAGAFLGLAGLASAASWPGWRGPAGDGQSAEKDVPLKWDRDTNVLWQTPLPGPGNSSPIVWGQRVFLTQALDRGKRRAVLCFDRADGRLLWQRETPCGAEEPTHSTNPYCSATPVTDGERVIASLGSAGLVCYDFAGKELWRKDVGKMLHIWGNASSPILYRDLAILWVGPGERQVLLAADRRSGKTVWQQEPGGKFGKKAEEWVGSWSTPLVARVAGHDELILSVPEKVKGFDPATGKELWSCAGLGKLVYTSPLCSPDGIVVTLSGFHGPALAVRAGGRGDVTATHRLWLHPRPLPQRIGSGVLVGAYLYLLNENGTAQCFELKTGKDLWAMKRLSTPNWGSLVHAAGRLYVTNLAGETLVLAPGPKPVVLARNRLNERTLASPAVADGRVFVRTYKHLWCIGHKKDAR